MFYRFRGGGRGLDPFNRCKMPGRDDAGGRHAALLQTTDFGAGGRGWADFFITGFDCDRGFFLPDAREALNTRSKKPGKRPEGFPAVFFETAAVPLRALLAMFGFWVSFFTFVLPYKEFLEGKGIRL
jgi:hypothetical protein